MHHAKAQAALRSGGRIRCSSTAAAVAEQADNAVPPSRPSPFKFKRLDVSSFGGIKIENLNKSDPAEKVGWRNNFAWNDSLLSSGSGSFAQRMLARRAGLPAAQDTPASVTFADRAQASSSEPGASQKANGPPQWVRSNRTQWGARDASRRSQTGHRDAQRRGVDGSRPVGKRSALAPRYESRTEVAPKLGVDAAPKPKLNLKERAEAAAAGTGLDLPSSLPRKMRESSVVPEAVTQELGASEPMRKRAGALDRLSVGLGTTDLGALFAEDAKVSETNVPEKKGVKVKTTARVGKAAGVAARKPGTVSLTPNEANKIRAAFKKLGGDYSTKIPKRALQAQLSYKRPLRYALGVLVYRADVSIGKRQRALGIIDKYTSMRVAKRTRKAA
ncbi:hypothetical protein K488DRAFT_84407 [Vararia minispora EC-137]|uniref:Uncharacterized protein n=1 Tax=Vararia minispora EC-137 TaxID=1314806 RepID=A0ACB8QQ11_9AGAM|nr:hypothetical protein K488DRAFT_84407 [Vararia minispora EC-137]